MPIEVRDATLFKAAPQANAVIGVFPDYKRFGISLHKEYFSVDPAQWEALQRSGKSQAVNDAWVDKGIEKGWTFLVVKNADGSYGAGTKAEIKRLLDKGYTFNDDGTLLLPPAQKH